jgi:hypothetical protein
MSSKVDWRKRSKVYNAIERAMLSDDKGVAAQADEDFTAYRSRTLTPERFNHYLT